MNAGMMHRLSNRSLRSRGGRARVPALLGLLWLGSPTLAFASEAAQGTSETGPQASSQSAQQGPMLPEQTVPPAAPPMSELRRDLRSYFAAEQRGGLVLMAMGAPAVALGAGLLVDTPDRWRGLAYPLLILGGVEFIGGLLFAARTPGQVRTLEHGLATQPKVALAGEWKRMQRVHRQFLVLEIVEVLLMTGGLALAATGGATKTDTLTGVGIGLAIEGSGLLVFDVFAAARARRYSDSLGRSLAAATASAP